MKYDVEYWTPDHGDDRMAIHLFEGESFGDLFGKVLDSEVVSPSDIRIVKVTLVPAVFSLWVHSTIGPDAKVRNDVSEDEMRRLTEEFTKLNAFSFEFVEND